MRKFFRSQDRQTRAPVSERPRSARGDPPGGSGKSASRPARLFRRDARPEERPDPPGRFPFRIVRAVLLAAALFLPPPATAGPPDMGETAAVPASFSRGDALPPRKSPAPANDGSGGSTPPSWEVLAPGLELATLENPADPGVRIAALRIDPERYDFSLHNVLWDGEPARPLEAWAENLDLTAAINAGMYLPDGRTGTGYMRRGEARNNRRIADNYGSFFVAGPRVAGLPGAAVLDRSVDDWETLLPQYEIVVQNFRLLGPDGAQLWPENGPMHAVAAVGMDRAGRILFLHCRSAVTVHGFVRVLLASPGLELIAAMYVEGGSQAAMLVRLPGFRQLWTGHHPADLFFGQVGRIAPLPHILGVRPGAGTDPASVPQTANPALPAPPPDAQSAPSASAVR